jgi:hypothetical protein
LLLNPLGSRQRPHPRQKVLQTAKTSLDQLRSGYVSLRHAVRVTSPLRLPPVLLPSAVYFCQEVALSADVIQNGSFRDGFEVGYRSIRGTAAGMPGIPGQPGTRGNMTPFMMGVRKGIERGLGRDIDELGS